MRIVIIDDDEDTHQFLTLFLCADDDVVVYSAYTGLDGIQMIQNHAPDLVLLDVRMPLMDGWEICKHIRFFSDVPVIMMTAAAKEDEDMVRGLEAGADDYIIKPITPVVLKARINALVRRSTNLTWRESRQVYIDAHLRVDLYRQEVYVDGKRISLSFLEYRLLELLIRNANTTITMLEIIEYLWSETTEGDYAQYVRIYIGRLRKLIEVDARDPQYIVTEHGFGYRFNTAK